MNSKSAVYEIFIDGDFNCIYSKKLLQEVFMLVSIEDLKEYIS